jgi:hypothetical protein
MDELLTMRELLGKSIAYIDAMPVIRNGKISLVLVRQTDLDDALILNESDYLDEPEPHNRGLEATQNLVRITFVERDNQWEEGVEPFDNPANAEVVGHSVERSLSYPWVTRRSVAKQIAKRVGIKSAVPPFFFDLHLKPSRATILPGDVVKVNSLKLGLVNRVCRVVDVTIDRIKEPGVTITAMAEQTRDTSHDYVPPEDHFNTPGTTDDQGGGTFDVVSASPLISVLPAALKGGKADGFLAVFGRTSRLIRKAEVWWSPSDFEAGGIPPFSYVRLLTVDSYPIYAAVLGVQQITPDSMTARVVFAANSPDSEDFAQLFEEATDLYAVTGQRTVRTLGTPGNEHMLMPIWMKKVVGGWFAALTSRVFEMEFRSGEFGAGAYLPETLAAAGTLPTDRIYIGRLPEFPIVTSDTIAFDRYLGNFRMRPNLPGDTDLRRWVKVTLANTRVRETPFDVDPVSYDRNDFTMQGGVTPSPLSDPGGTYDTEWGPKAMTTAEAADRLLGAYFLLTGAASYGYVEDVDEVFGTIVDGTVADENTFSYPPIDDALGLYAEKQNLLYSNNP